MTTTPNDTEAKAIALANRWMDEAKQITKERSYLATERDYQRTLLALLVKKVACLAVIAGAEETP